MKAVYWFRVGQLRIALHTPKAKPLFTERNGYRRPVWKWRRYRLFIEKEKQSHGKMPEL
jgi:hypothetical protein